MLLIIAILLLLFWGAGLVANIAGALIHILLVVAAAIFIMHFLRGNKG